MTDMLPKGGKTLVLKIADVVADPSVQPRERTDPQVVKDYEELMRSGVEMPDPVVFQDGHTFLLASGFHRLPAARAAGLKHVRCYVVPGTLADAALYAAGTNTRHGLQRGPGDKRRAVHLVLAHERAKLWPDPHIAAHCGVSVGLVKAIRQSTPWQPTEGLYGPLEDETPPPPDMALAETAEEAEDRERVRERMFRAGRKFARFAEAVGLTLEQAVEAIRQDIEARRERDRRHQKVKAEPPVVPGPAISMNGTI